MPKFAHLFPISAQSSRILFTEEVLQINENKHGRTSILQCCENVYRVLESLVKQVIVAVRYGRDVTTKKRRDFIKASGKTISISSYYEDEGDRSKDRIRSSSSNGRSKSWIQQHKQYE